MVAIAEASWGWGWGQCVQKVTLVTFSKSFLMLNIAFVITSSLFSKSYSCVHLDRYAETPRSAFNLNPYTTLVNVYVDLVVFTRIAGTS